MVIICFQCKILLDDLYYAALKDCYFRTKLEMVKYKQSDLHLALNEIKSKTKGSVTAIAKKYNIPRRTIYVYLNKKTCDPILQTAGRPTVLTKEEEDYLVHGKFLDDT